MTLEILLSILSERSIKILRRDDRLRIYADNDDDLDEDLVAHIKLHKEALLQRVPEDHDEALPSITPVMLPLVTLSQVEIDRIATSVVGGMTNIQDIYPLAPLQEGILFHHLLATDADPYILSTTTVFDSRERLDRYLHAVQAVIARHDILRTAVVWEGLDEPVQVVWREAPLPVEEVTLDPDGDDAVGQLHTYCDPRHYRMDIGRAPMMHAYVAQDTATGRWLLQLVRHHLTSDHTTLEVLGAEVQAYLLGEADRLPAPVPFRNFVAQARLGVSREEHEAYFREVLGDVDEPTAPFGVIDVRGDGASVEEASLDVPEELGQRLRAQARKHGVSAASLFHLAWAQVLATTSGRDDVVFGTVLFGRMQGNEEIGRAVGLFINTLPLRVRLHDRDVVAVLKETHESLVTLLHHEHVSLALAQRCSAIAAPAPLFSALLNYRHGQAASRSTREQSAWEGIEGLVGEERTNYPLILSVDDLGSALFLKVQAQRSIDPAQVAGLMSRALEQLTSVLEVGTDQPILTLDVLPVAERHQVLEGWNATTAAYPSEACVHELFEAQVMRSPAATAVVYEETSLSYAQLNAQANQLARHLRTLGVGPDSRVALCVERGLPMMVGLLAVLKAGGAYVPLDPAYPVERLRYMLEDSAPLAVLTQDGLGEAWSSLTTQLSVPVLDIGGVAPVWSDQSDTNLAPEGLTSSHLAYVIYTSGSTGQPKGAMNEHRAVINRLCWMQATYGLGADDAVLQKTPSSFDVSVWEFFWPLLAGARLVMARAGGHKDAGYLVEAIQHYRITTMHFVPSMLQLFVGEAAVRSCTTLRQVICSGEALPSSLVAQFHRMLPEARLDNLYGPTEAAVDVTWWACERGIIPLSIPIGRPIGNARIYILDGRGEPVPIGVAGEIHIGGVPVGRGYLNRPELTAERFVVDPFRGEGRMYKTGDLAKWLPDGTIAYLGRNDFQVKLRGFRIELGEIEARLREQAGVCEAVVIAREDTPGDTRLVAYVVLEDDTQFSVAALRGGLSSTLAEYMVPSAFVPMEALPLTPNGKLDRKALPAPEGDAYVVREYEAPQGEVEEAIASVWSQLLKHERVGRHDNFFELGGHSLLAIQMISRLREALGRDVPLRQLFATPVLREFAAAMTVSSRTTLPAVPAVTLATPEARRALSFAQQRLWFLHELEGNSRTYHVPLGLQLDGPLDRVALRRALDRMVMRHEALRTSFPSVDGQPAQHIAANATFDLIEHDLADRPEAEAEQARLLAEEAAQPFDLARGPLIRGVLIVRSAQSHALLITMHHIVTDGWSMGIFVNELSTLYQAFSEGKADPLAPLAVQYADYAAWQRAWLDGERLAEQSAYWKAQLVGAPALLDLPTDRPRPLQQDYAGDVVACELDEALTTALRALSRRHGTTLFMTLLASWSALLSRLSGQDEVVIGTPTANRGRQEIEGLIGFFVNTLALRVDLSGEPTVATLLERVKATAVAAQQHQDLPFEQVVEVVRPARNLAHSPIFQAMFAWQNQEGDRFEPSELKVRSKGRPLDQVKFDLDLNLGEVNGKIVGVLHYATGLFDRSTIKRYRGYFIALLRAMTDDDSIIVADIEMVDDDERRLLMVDYNRTEHTYPSEATLDELIEAQVMLTPDAIAVIHGEQRLTYRQFNDKANMLARQLKDVGCLHGDIIPVVMSGGIEVPLSFLAIMKAGAVFAPLDSEWPVGRLLSTLENMAARTVLCDASTFVNSANDGSWITVDASALGSAGNVAQRRSSRSPIYVVHTSGSTGRPKGAINLHCGIVNRLSFMNRYFGDGSDEVVLQTTFHCFDSAVWQYFWPLIKGGTVVIPVSAHKLDFEELFHLIVAHRVTITDFTPALLNLFLEWVESKSDDYFSAYALRNIVVGGEELKRATFLRFKERFSRVRLHNFYGPSETSIGVICHELSNVGDLRIPIGRPIDNVMVAIVNSRMAIVPAGVVGELLIGGDCVGAGYLSRPEETERGFIRNSFQELRGDVLYRTGDLARYRSDGAIEYIGRIDHQVKLRGFRIELGEIEARLREQAGVCEAVVIAREDTPGDTRLVAYVVLEDDTQFSVAALRSGLSSTLAEYMVPSAFVPMEALPLTPNGKLDRKALPAPEGDAYVVREYEAPQGEVEEAIASVWSQLLKHERVGRHDNFFELGGHSLLAMQVLSRLREALGRDVALRQLFTTPVLAEFAAAMGAAAATTLPAVTPATSEARRALSFAQQRLWFLDQMEGSSHTYNVPLALQLDGPLDRVALRRALDRMVMRHEALRTSFPSMDGQPAQHIAADATFDLIEHDLADRPEAEAEQARLLAEEAAQPFDLARGPLIRGVLIVRSAQSHALLITMHHIVTDGWSMGIFVNELSTLYQALSEGKADPLAPLAVQYADYAAWQRAWLDGERLAEQSAYWKAQLVGAPALLDLPTDRPRPLQQDYAGDVVACELDEALTTALRALSRRHGTTLFMTLLASWSALLSRLSGQDEVVIGTPTANRGRQEIEGLIGFFVNTLALRVDLSGEPTVATLLERVKATAVAAQQHQDLPFEQVVEVVRPARNLAHSPIFQAMFNWQESGSEDVALGSLHLRPFYTRHSVAKFDLSLSLVDTGTVITGGWEYATALFDRATVERFIACWITLLRAMVRDEAQAVDRLPLLGAAERHQVLEGWNATTVAYPSEACVHELFEAQVMRSPAATAVVYEETSLSYAQLNAQANQLARHLRALGVGPDSRVALCVERGLPMMVGLLAVLKAGGAYVPLDPAYPVERLRYMLEDSAPVVVLTQAGLGETWQKLTTQLSVPVLDIGGVAPVWSDQSDTNLDRADLTSSHLAYVIYTSGSTGQPKGVMVEHAQLTRLLASTEAWFHFGHDDVWTLFHSYAFDFSVWELWGALAYGGRLVVVPLSCARSPKDFYALLCSKQVTVLNQTPSAFRALIHAQDEQTHRLRCVIFGGEALEPRMLAPWVERNDLSQTRLINMYGATEITVHATYQEIVREDIEAERGSVVGCSLPDLRIYLLDAHGEPVPIGVFGEMYIAGPGVARGYLNRPALTAERFSPDPFQRDPIARMYRSGDLGKWLPDGTIEYLGRNDFQVKLRGFRIELGEIEAKLSACVGVREAIVIAREDVPGDKQLVAYVAAREGHTLSVATLREELSSTLAEYMVPSAFVSMGALPLTPNGKLDRNALPAPEASAYLVQAYEAPQGATEEAIAKVWASLLKHERVGRHDNFFELGGHSLLAITAIGHLHRHGVVTDVRTLFAAPTVVGLATAVARVDLAPTPTVQVNGIPDDCMAILPTMLPLVTLSQAEIDRVATAVPGGMTNIQDIYPLAPLQEGILFHHLMAADADPYILSSTTAFDGRERLDRYLQAVQAVIARHDILRTAVVWEGLDEPVQVVWREAPLPVEEVTLDPDGDDAVGQLHAYCDPRHYRMDIGRAPMMHAFVAHDPGVGRWFLLLLHHHLVSDYTTLKVLGAEVQAYLLGEADQLPVPVPFRNFVAQARLGVSREEHEAYFREMLGDVDEPTAPFGVIDVRGDGTGVEEASLDVPEELGQRLRTQARKHGVSAASLFHLAWAQVLATTSGRDDVVFGTVLFGRMQGNEETGRAVGLFVNTLPLRVQLNRRDAATAVKETHESLVTLLHHEHVSLALAQRCSAIAAPAPLFSALLNYRHGQAASRSTREQSAWEGIEGLVGEERTNYPLILLVDDSDSALLLKVQAQRSIDPVQVAQLVTRVLEQLVLALEAGTAKPILALDVLPVVERHQVLEGWNATTAAYPSEACVHELFEAQVMRSPAATAVVYEETSLSYAQLNAQANQLARHLRTLGVGPDSRVALCVERGLPMMVGLLAVLKAGGAYVPLDPAYPVERLRYMLEDSAPLAVLTQDGLGEAWSSLTTQLSVPVLDIGGVAPVWSDQSDTNLAPEGLTSSHLAYVIYTSGSTGQPKGAMNEHRAVINRLCWMQATYGLGADDAVLQKTPSSFDVSVWEFFWPLLAGARLVMARAGGHKDAGYLVEAIQHYRITTMHFVPSMLQLFVGEAAVRSCTTLRQVICSGEALPSSLVAQFHRMLPEARLDNLYGPTEAAVDVTWWACERGIIPLSIPIGRPIGNARIYILDGRGEPVPIGVAGEIHIGGVPVGRGYLNRPELTAERFVVDPFRGEGRMYKTGDLAKWLPDGTIAYLGRNDFQVKLRGFRIELGEIEARLREQAGVCEAVVIAREDTPGDTRLVAYVVLEDDTQFSVAALRGGLSSTLAEYMVPSAFVPMEALPLTPNGKLDRKALPAPEGDAYVVREYEAPQGEVEEAIASVWSQLLKHERVGRHDNFFELGGHSLLAIQMISRLREALGRDVPLRQLFATPVLREFAAAMTVSSRTTLPAVPAVTLATPEARRALSFAQQRLWFLHELEGNSRTYHVPLGLQLDGPLDRVALRRALDRMVMRHEALRTSFPSVDGQPAQHIAANATFDLIEHDLADRPEAEAEQARLLAEEAAQPFDLARGPLIRGVLIVRSAQSHALLITMHHIVTDGWSMGIFVNELSTLYQAFSEGKADPLAPLAVQYADYAAWQRAWLDGERLAEQSAYWKAQLVGAPALLDLPTDRPRPLQQDYAGDVVACELDEALTTALRALSRRHGTTLFMTLLASWSALLSRLSGQDEVVIGTPTANRGRQEIEGLIGFFVNTLALRVDLSGEPTVATLLERVKATAVAAQQHQDLPFEQVVEVVRPARNLAHSPIFQAMFAWQNQEGDRFEPSELKVRSKGRPLDQVKFDLDLNLGEVNGKIVGVLHYATGLFDRSTIKRYRGYFIALLRAMTDDDSIIVADIEMVDDDERRLLMVDYNRTEHTYPSEATLDELIEAQVMLTPDAIAVIHGEQRLTYRQFNDKANMLARQLKDVGCLHGDIIPVVMSGGIEVPLSFLAIMKAGAVFAPLDSEWPVGRLLSTLENMAARTVLCDASTFVNSANDGSWITVDASALGSAGNVAQRRSSRSPIYVVHTSGSTGRPKGAINLHCGIVNRLSFMNRYFGDGSDEVVLQTTFHCFDSAVWQYFWPLIKGGTVVIPVSAHKLDFEELFHLIVAHRVTITDFTPALLNLFLEWVESKSDDYFSAYALRNIVVGGEELKRATFLRFKERFSRVRLHNFYGPSETSIGVICHELSNVGDLRIPIGRPIDNVMVAIVNSRMAIVPAGVVGELLIGGDCVGAGYLSRPEETERGFIRNSFQELRGDVLYRTGDLARYRSDGAIEYIGRIDHQVKLRGFRIELGEIEARLREQAGVCEAVVIAREDTPGDTRLVAYVVLEDDTQFSVAALRSGLSSTLAEYMVPSAFVPMEALPLTPNGKLDRKALPAPEGDAYVVREYEAPQGEVEEAIASVWSQLLKHERVGRHDNFFELGGHSLLAMQVLSRLREALGRDVALRQLFTTPVLAEFAAAMGAAAATTLPAVTPATSEARRALSFAQQRLWFLDQMEGSSHTYNVPLALQLDGPLDRVALRRALDRMVMRHEALRTSFPSMDGQPAQHIAADATFDLIEHDLADRPEAEAEQARLLAEEAAQPFDLARGPLIRGVLIVRSAQSHALLITMHHIVTDGWSMGIFVNELSTLYQALSEGKADPLAPLAVQYADYAAWQRAWLDGERLAEQSAYWKAQLVGAPALLDLPTDRPRPLQQDYAGDVVACELDEALTTALRALSRRHGTTLFMTLLASWSALLSRLSGQDEVVIGTPTANRGRQEIEGLIGFFVNTLALRVDLSGEPTVATLLERVKATAVAAQQHQDLPFEQVVEVVRPARDLAHSPIFQTLFNWQESGSEDVALGSLHLRPFYTRHSVAKFDLSLSLVDTGTVITGGWEYATALFDRATVERFIACWITLLRAMVRDEAQAVDRLPLLGAAERHQVLEGWNATTVAYPSEACVHELFEAQVMRSPAATAVVYEETSLSYAQLNAQANQLARHLRALGVGPDSRVALCVERGLPMMVGLLAVLKAGGAYVPLDPAYPVERLRYMLEDSAPLAVLTQDGLGEAWSSLTTQLSVPVLDIGGVAPVWSDQSDTNLAPEGLTSSHLAYVIYTSGSTGQPKGVMVEHGGVVNLLVAMRDVTGIDAGSRLLSLTTVAFDIAALELFLPLHVGATVMVPGHATSRDPAQLSQALTHFDATMVQATPATWRMLIEAGWQGDKSIKAICGGEAMSAQLASSLVAQVGGLWNVYGPTETTIWSSVNDVCTAIAGSRARVSIGRPLANTRIYILDAHGVPVPAGVTGELFIGGVGVARGYLNRAELTAERFVVDPFRGEGRMYKTGDLGKWLPDGTIEYLGRNDFQVKLRGFRIELGEIEARLREQAGVLEAVVIAREDSPGDTRLVAYVVLEDDTQFSVAALRGGLSSTLAEYMVPSAFVPMEALPLTPNGKLDRKALPAPEGDAYVVREYEAPQGEVEEAIASVWSQLLKHERVGRHDNFFELGGHSLLAIRLVSALNSAKYDTTIAELFTYPTIAGFAKIKEAKHGSAQVRAIAFRPEGTRHPLFVMHDGGCELFYAPKLAAALDKSLPIYGLPAASSEEPVLETLQAQGARLVSLIRKVQPEGPYHLIGWSTGGLLAYEVAYQLCGLDAVVGFIGLIDTFYMPTLATNRSSIPSNPAEVVRTEIKMAAKVFGMLEEDYASFDHGDLETLVELGNRYGLMGAYHDRSVRDIEHGLKARLTLAHAAADYHARGFNVPVHLFRAMDQDTGQTFRGWDRVEPAIPLIVRDVPGDHQTIMREPNIGHLTSEIWDALNAAPASPPPPSSRQLLIPLQKGTPHGATFVMLPGAGASITVFTELLSVMPSATSIYGLQPRGLDEDQDTPHSDVAAAARAYASEIAATISVGTVHLVGHSFGGWIACELARVLESLGYRIGTLTLIDSKSPVETLSPDLDDIAVLLTLMQIYEDMAGADMGVTRDVLAKQTFEERIEHLHRLLVKHGLVDARLDQSFIANVLKVFSSCLRTGYVPSPDPYREVTLVLLKDAGLQPDENARQQQMTEQGWRSIFPQLESVTGAGTHMTAFGTPFVSDLVPVILRGVPHG